MVTFANRLKDVFSRHLVPTLQSMNDRIADLENKNRVGSVPTSEKLRTQADDEIRLAIGRMSADMADLMGDTGIIKKEPALSANLSAVKTKTVDPKSKSEQLFNVLMNFNSDNNSETIEDLLSRTRDLDAKEDFARLESHLLSYTADYLTKHISLSSNKKLINDVTSVLFSYASREKDSLRMQENPNIAQELKEFSRNLNLYLQNPDNTRASGPVPILKKMMDKPGFAAHAFRLMISRAMRVNEVHGGKVKQVEASLKKDFPAIKKLVFNSAEELGASVRRRELPDKFNGKFGKMATLVDHFNDSSYSDFVAFLESQSSSKREGLTKLGFEAQDEESFSIYPERIDQYASYLVRNSRDNLEDFQAEEQEDGGATATGGQVMAEEIHKEAQLAVQRLAPLLNNRQLKDLNFSTYDPALGDFGIHENDLEAFIQKSPIEKQYFAEDMPKAPNGGQYTKPLPDLDEANLDLFAKIDEKLPEVLYQVMKPAVEASFNKPNFANPESHNEIIDLVGFVNSYLAHKLIAGKNK